MKNVYNNKSCNSGMIQVHVEPPPIPLIKGSYYGKSEKSFVKLELFRDSTPNTLDFYELKMYLFDNEYPDEFFCSCITST